MTKAKAVICPYCGETQATSGAAADRCRACGGLFEPLSLQATHNAMGPWFVRDPARPFQPGCSYETLVRMVERGRVTKMSLIRGPTTKQFWTIAKRVPGVAHLLGYCHNCDASVDAGDHGCHACGVPFGAYLDRNYLGLPEVRPLPWEAGADEAGLQDTDAAVGRAIAWGRPSSGRGLSSFASDEELMGAGAELRAGAGAEGAGGGEPSASWPDGGGASSTSSFGAATETATDVVAGARYRAVQQRLARQQQTTRVLMAILGVAVLFAGVMAARWRTPANQTESGPPAPTAAHSPDKPADSRPPESKPAVAVPGEIRPVESPAPTADPVPAPPASEQPAPPAPSSAPKPAPASPIPGPVPGIGPPTEGPYVGEYDRSLALLARAEEVDRAMEERILDAEEALAVLKNIAARAPVDQQPADLAANIERAERLLGLLRPPQAPMAGGV